MFSVAIVEDTRADLDVLMSVLQRYEKEHGKPVKIASFDNAEKFLISYKPIYDVVFFDIELGDISGMDAAQQLRKVDGEVNIIFVTNMAQYALAGYKVGALDYFLKPVSYFDIEMRLQRLQRISSVSGAVVKVPISGGVKNIPAAELQYIEIMDHTLTYHTEDNDFSVRGDSLSKLEKELAPHGFARCSSSYLVNLKWCREINSESVIVGGRELRLTRGMRSKFVEQFTQLFSAGGSH